MKSLIWIWAQITLTFGVFGQDEVVYLNQLRKKLLKDQNYDPRSRPVKSHLTTTVISIQSMIREILELDIQTQILKTHLLFTMKWKDEHLQWNPSEYDGISKVFFGYYEIWKPTLLIFDSVDSTMVAGIEDQTKIYVNSSGHATLYLGIAASTNCPLDLSYFPNDEQTCIIGFSAGLYSTSEATLDPGKGKVIYSSATTDRNDFSLTNASLEKFTFHNENETEEYLEILMRMRRKSASYSYYVTYPYVLASLFGIAMFVFPPNSNQRFVFGGTALFLLLNLLVFLGYFLGFRSIVAPYAVRSISYNMLLIVLGLTMTTLSSHLIYKLREYVNPMPNLMVNLLNSGLTLRLCCVCDSDVDELRGSEERSVTKVKSNNKEWIRVVTIVDRAIFILYLIVFTLYHT